LFCFPFSTNSHWAAIFGLTETGKILIEAKADVNCTTKSGETPLHLCAEKGKIEFVKLLLEAGARTDLRDKVFSVLSFVTLRELAEMMRKFMTVC
jgi:ankyrin repeat protein